MLEQRGRGQGAAGELCRVASGGMGLDVHNRDGIVIEDCRDVFRGELVRRVADEKTCLSDSTVTDDDAPIKQHSSVNNKLRSLGGTSFRGVIQAPGRVWAKRGPPRQRHRGYLVGCMDEPGPYHSWGVARVVGGG